MNNIKGFLENRYTNIVIDQAYDFIVDLKNANGNILNCFREKYQYVNNEYYLIQENAKTLKTENIVLASAAFNINNELIRGAK